MYEAVVAGDRSTPSRLAATAAGAGYDGVVLRNAAGLDRRIDTAAVEAATDVDVALGGVVGASEPAAARGAIDELRPDVECLFVRGGSPAVNRLAVETPSVDVLAAPMRGSGDLNHVMANAAAENDVHLEVDLGPVLRTSGGRRVRAIQGLRKLADLVEDADAPYVVSAAPETHLELRSVRALTALGDAVGLGTAFVDAGLSAWASLLERNRHRRAPETVGPGVRVASGEEGAGDGVAEDDPSAAEDPP